jgi:site-specific recombinase XerD
LGGKLNDLNVSKQFKTYRRLATLPEPRTFHALLHPCASWFVQHGVSLFIVQHILGRSDIQVTQKYAHLAPT